MRTPEQTLNLVREAIKDHNSNRLPSYTTLMVIRMLVMPNKPSPEAIKWAQLVLKEQDAIKNRNAEIT